VAVQKMLKTHPFALINMSEFFRKKISGRSEMISWAKERGDTPAKDAAPTS
jgi:hypothetical protein